MEQHEQLDDVRTQLKFFEQLDQMEKQRKEEQEREILLKAAKVTSWEKNNRPRLLSSLHFFFVVELKKKKSLCQPRNQIHGRKCTGRSLRCQFLFSSLLQSRSRQEDPEQLRLKQKAKEVSL